MDKSSNSSKTDSSSNNTQPKPLLSKTDADFTLAATSSLVPHPAPYLPFAASTATDLPLKALAAIPATSPASPAASSCKRLLLLPRLEHGETKSCVSTLVLI
jgi:hypothetical protein